ncbi:hypothetical protein [Kitasatospora sp. LaBMicrA B282]|uniref:hypothetical protein n=1 Tax=Kitasatospora sp. LaBMicrA B282 TaxID=3420949 RepID=UPI003D0F1CA3
MHPLTPLLYLLARVERGGGAGLEPGEVAELRGLRTRLSAIVPHHPGEAELVLFRLAHAPAPTVRALCREVGSVLKTG